MNANLDKTATERLARARAALEFALAPADGDERGRRLALLVDLPVRYRPTYTEPTSLWDLDTIPPMVDGVLTIDHATSSQGLPVLLGACGPLGPGEVAGLAYCGYEKANNLWLAALAAGYRVLQCACASPTR